MAESASAGAIARRPPSTRRHRAHVALGSPLARGDI